MFRLAEERRLRRLRRYGALLGAAAAAFVATGVALSSFDSTTTGGPMAISTKRIFPYTETVTAYDAGDASGGGAEVWAGAIDAFNDNRVVPSAAAWATTFSTARYIDFSLNAPLPGGLALSGVNFNFDYASAVAGDQTCFYFQVIQASTGTVLGTHGSDVSPIACTTASTTQVTATALPEVSTSTIADNLKIRVFESNSAGRQSKTDAANVSGSTPYASFTLYSNTRADASGGGTPVTGQYPIWALDASARTSSSAWATTFSTSRYLRYTIPAYLPSGAGATATVTAASFIFSFRPTVNGNNQCYYFDVLQGATLLATHGSSASPIACDSTTTFLTTTTSLPEVSSAAIADNLIIKVYMSDSGAGTGQVNRMNVSVGYYLD